MIYLHITAEVKVTQNGKAKQQPILRDLATNLSSIGYRSVGQRNEKSPTKYLGQQLN